MWDSLPQGYFLDNLGFNPWRKSDSADEDEGAEDDPADPLLALDRWRIFCSWANFLRASADSCLVPVEDTGSKGRSLGLAVAIAIESCPVEGHAGAVDAGRG